jgi:hypothetical protein
MKREDFIYFLNQNNLVFHKHGSRHDIYIHEITGKKVSVPRHKEIKNKFLKLIIDEITKKGI